ncbi:MAG: hypothetical protein KTR31_12530, partial [Myxococcales bacterium]|nr:hypothetical protein [Myxococcales bacterium]
GGGGGGGGGGAGGGGLGGGGLVKGWAIAATLRVDAPTGPGTFQDRDVPLGNGQWEITPGVRVGRSLHPYGWVEMWQAVSIRARSARTGTDPGDEWRPVMALGLTPVESAGVSLRVEGLIALGDEDAFGLSHPGRSLLQVRGALFAQPVGPAWIEVGAAVPLAGRRWPAAASPYVSVSWLFARSGDE